MKISSKPLFFKTTADLRKWFENHHDQSAEIWIGFYKKKSGKVSVSYYEALDQAICYGWIDGIRKSLNELSYANRFTPRRPKSNWSKINVAHAKRLKKSGQIHAAGLAEIARAKLDGRWKK